MFSCPCIFNFGDNGVKGGREGFVWSIISIILSTCIYCNDSSKRVEDSACTREGLCLYERRIMPVTVWEKDYACKKKGLCL